MLFGTSNGVIYTINTSTGAATVVGDTGLSYYGHGLAFSSANVLYTGINNELFSVDQSTGALTLVTALDYSALPGNLVAYRPNGMKFDAQTGTLLASITGGSGSNFVGTINIATGVVSLAGPTVTGLDAIALGNSPVNKATVSGGGESNTANDTARDATTILYPDLAITKTHSGNFTQGQTGATYTIVVSNSGGLGTSGTVTVVDTAPTGLTPTDISKPALPGGKPAPPGTKPHPGTKLAAADISMLALPRGAPSGRITRLAGSGWACTLGTLTCTRTDALAPATSYPAITVTVDVAPDAPSTVTSTATVSGGSEVNTSNDTATDVTTINQLPDLTIAKSHSGNFTQGQTGAIYTITVSNAGPSATSGTVTMTDTLPAGLTSTSGARPPIGRPTPTPRDFTTKDASGAGWDCTTSTLTTLTCTRSDALAPGASYPDITLTVDVASNAAASVTNTATVSGGGEANTSNDTANDVTTISPPAAFTNGGFISDANGWTLGGGCSFAQWSGGVGNPPGSIYLNSCGEPTSDPFASQTLGGFIPGQTYTVSVDVLLDINNAGGSNGKSFGIFLDSQPGNPIFLGEFLDASWHTVCKVNFTATSTSHTIIFAAELDSRTPGVPSTSDMSYYIDNVSLSIAGPDLTVTKSHTGNFTQGQTGATYSITVTNAGNLATTGTVTMHDTLPAGLTATAISGSGWTCTLGTLTCTRSDALTAGASYPAITVTVNVANNASSGSQNWAASWNGDGAGPGTFSITPSSGQSATEDLRYSVNLGSAGGVAPTSWNYQTTSSGSGVVSFNWEYTGFNSYFNVTAFAKFFVGATQFTLVNAGPASCCTPPSGGYDYFGTASFPVNAGDQFGFTLGGSNSDSNSQINGELIVTNFSAPGFLANRAAVSGGGEINASNDTVSDPTTIIPLPDLTVTKSHTGNFSQGQSGAAYTITVTNSGLAATSGTVTVTDTLPTGLTSTILSRPPGSGPTPKIAGGSGWTCQLGAPICTRSDALAPGASYPDITLTVDVADNAAASVTNSVTVSGGGESNTSNDTANDPTTINQVPDLTVTKTHSGNFSQGQTGAVYTIKVTNSGGAATSGLVTVNDTLPAGLVLNGSRPPAGRPTPTPRGFTAKDVTGTGWTCTPAISCTRSDALAAGASYPDITVTVDVAPDAGASINNSATVSGGGETFTSNDTANDSTTITQIPNLTVTSSHTGNFNQGQTGDIYTITVSNSGGASTSGTVTMTDTLPTGLTATAIGGSGWTCTLGTLTCTRNDLLAGGSSYPVINLTVNVAANAPASITNVATVSGGGETYTADDSANDPTTVNPLPDMTVSMTDTPDPVVSVGTLTYTITATNSGNASASSATITDTLPGTVTYVSCVASVGSCSQLSGTVTASLGTLATSTSATMTITVTAPSVGSPTFVANTATVSTSTTESNTANNQATVTTTVTPSGFIAPAGGPPGGSVNALVADPRSPDTLYAGTVGFVSGVYKSTNGGASWTAFSTGLSIQNVWALAIDTAGNIFVGGPNGGVWKSSTNSPNWSHFSDATLGTTAHVTSLAVDSTAGVLYAGTSDLGVFKSPTTAPAWAAFNTGLGTLSANALVLDGAGNIYVGNSSGVFKSPTSSANWTDFNTGLPSVFVESLAVDMAGNIFLGTNSAGVFKSSTSAANWALFVSGPLASNAFVFSLVADTAGNIYAGTFSGAGVLKSPTSAANWAGFNTGLGSLGAAALVLDGVGNLYAGTLGGSGIYKTAVTSAAWVGSNTGLTSTDVRG